MVPGDTYTQRERIELEADPRHVDILRQHFNLATTSKPLVAPGVKPTSADPGQPLTGQDSCA